jgi:imidazolonepropionase
MRSVTLFTNANLVCLTGKSGWALQKSGAILTADEQIVAVCQQSDVLVALMEMKAHQSVSDVAAIEAMKTINLQGALVTPGLIDAHTHLVYGGDRADEFELRLQGASYEELSRRGAGIMSTVRATRLASEEALFLSAIGRAKTLLKAGVTTIEIKSGYGLSALDEERCLRVARQIALTLPMAVKTTYLAAHALPPEFAGKPDEYITAVCEWLVKLHANNLVDAVDAFCENIAFSALQVRKLFEQARALHIPVKLHSEQLSDHGGTLLATEFNALSCDHLEHLSQEGIQAMAASGTVAMLLPGAFYFLRETKQPPVNALRAAGVPIAIATDHNPGSSPTLCPTLVMNMACTFFRLTPEEALRGMTVNAAKALGLTDRGQLMAGLRADFVAWPEHIQHPNQLMYSFGQAPEGRVFIAAKEVSV